MTPRVSYILTTKDRALRLARTLEWVRTLLRPSDELIVVDGASRDGTRQVVESFADIVTDFISEPDLGPAHALNKGILRARGTYIKQLTDDDLIHAEAMEQALALLERHPEVDLLLCGGVKQRRNRSWAVWLPAGTHYGQHPEDVFRYLGPASGTGHVIRRQSLARLGLLPLRANADAAFVLEAIRRGATVRFARIRLYHHPQHNESTSVRERRTHLADTVRLLREYCSPAFAIRCYLTFILPQRLALHPNRFTSGFRTLLKFMFPRRRPRVEECIWDGRLS